MIAAYLKSMARRFLRRGANEREMDEELEAHVRLRADSLERGGLERAEAKRSKMNVICITDLTLRRSPESEQRCQT